MERLVMFNRALADHSSLAHKKSVITDRATAGVYVSLVRNGCDPLSNLVCPLSLSRACHGSPGWSGSGGLRRGRPAALPSRQCRRRRAQHGATPRTRRQWAALVISGLIGRLGLVLSSVNELGTAVVVTEQPVPGCGPASDRC